MTREEIIRMAREQGLPETDVEGVFRVNSDDLGRFAALVAAAEQEACAKECDWVLARLSEMAEDIGADAAFSCLEMIRKRGEK
jgi:hypothetical protein